MMNKPSQYRLLPFHFTRINGKELLVNEVGDYLFTPSGTVASIVTGHLDPTSVLYKDLLSKFMICDAYHDYLLDILATRLRTKKSFLKGTALHIFVLTLRCNQKCIYCQAISQAKQCSTKDMRKEDIASAIRLMLMSPNQHLTMEFQGGESSLVPDLLEYAIMETERQNSSIGKEIRYVICTNIIHVTDHLLDILEKYHVYVSTSLDGPDFIHDHNRGVKGSYLSFCESLKKISDRLGRSRISSLMTTSDYSLDYPRQIVDSYRKLQFHYIFLRPLNPYGRALNNRNWEEYNDRFLTFYKEALNYIIEINQQGEKFIEGFTAMLMKKILTPFPIGFVDLQSPAGIINSVIVYNYDGKVYCSDESRMLAEQGDQSFCLGSVNDSYTDLFYGRKAQQLSKVWTTECVAGCSDCAYQQYCGADPVRNYSTQADPYGYRPTGMFCNFHKSVFDYLFEMIDKRGNQVLPIFRVH